EVKSGVDLASEPFQWFDKPLKWLSIISSIHVTSLKRGAHEKMANCPIVSYFLLSSNSNRHVIGWALLCSSRLCVIDVVNRAH
ncbi:MAG: hypothetical protein QOI77_3401, partial [Blastocatellia bacterium]|nr:hypothetical protein [Blastocatellia bacterium]